MNANNCCKNVQSIKYYTIPPVSSSPMKNQKHELLLLLLLNLYHPRHLHVRVRLITDLHLVQSN